jgi:hypothetical protein
MPRVLIVNSIDDSITRNRATLLAQSPRLSAYEILHTYVIDVTTHRDYETACDMLREQPLNADEVFTKLRCAIDANSPDVVVAHTGFVFARFPSLFFEVFRRLRSTFPNVRFAFQPHHAIPIDPSAQDDGVFVEGVVRDVFWGL